jgi:hypothetical protein
MKRRDVLAASCLAGLAPLARAAAPARAEGPAKQVFDLRLYQVKSEEQGARLEEFLAKAATAAFNRAGVSPVGVFRFADGKAPDRYVLLPHGSCQSVMSLTARLMGDEQFLKDGAAWLDLPRSDPLYERIESSLLLGFDEAPRVVAPEPKPGRLFQLRIYESHSLKKAQKKVEMFNAGGEIALFRRTGMNVVFFGEAIVSPRLPHLTYMLTFESKDAQKAAWATFLGSPEWRKMSGDPQYRDTVSRITNIELLPAACSQI